LKSRSYLEITGFTRMAAHREADALCVLLILWP